MNREGRTFYFEKVVSILFAYENLSYYTPVFKDVYFYFAIESSDDPMWEKSGHRKVPSAAPLGTGRKKVGYWKWHSHNLKTFLP